MKTFASKHWSLKNYGMQGRHSILNYSPWNVVLIEGRLWGTNSLLLRIEAVQRAMEDLYSIVFTIKVFT